MNDLLREFIWQKRNGFLDTPTALNETDPKLWRNTIPYDLLAQNVRDSSENVRINTLTLIVESRKSTLKFAKQEFDIIYTFLVHNVIERSEYVPLLKKVFKRIHDSFAVMKKQLHQEEKAREHFKKEHDDSLSERQDALALSLQTSEKINTDIKEYKHFYKVIHNVCVASLQPDAVYHRRRSALQILCLMKDVSNDEFKDIEWTSEEVESVLTCLLLDTYEQNKVMALEILKVLDITLLRLNEESRVSDLLNVALELGNSIRPIDSITASYILKLCLLSPVIQNVLKSTLNEDICTYDFPEATVLQIFRLLVKKLQECCIVAKENIVLAVTKHSLYGYIFCLRSLLNECNLRDSRLVKLWQSTIAEVITLCFELNHVVSVIVNNSSPEGHLPMDLNTDSTKNMFNQTRESVPVTAQMVLLCSWRTVKEVSLLFGLLATKILRSDTEYSTELLTEEQIIKIGEHLVSLLCETKHRGAFEQAHVGFYQLCMRLWRLKDSKLNELPRTWLHQILIAITGFAQENSKLCATRRSAGVPFMIQALLSSEPLPRKNAKTRTFLSVMKILLGLIRFENSENLCYKVKQLLYEDTIFSDYEALFESSRYNSNENSNSEDNARLTELKTHALNILRAIFRDSQFGELVNDYVADGLIASFNSYNSVTWAERNAATLLFSALIVRIFGVQRTKDHINLTIDNKMSGKIFFERYPALQSFVLKQLSKFTIEDLRTGDAMKSNMHPVLLLLSRLHYSQKLDPSDSHWFDIINFVSKCAISPVYETRKLAARALVSLVPESSSADIMQQLLDSVSQGQNNSVSLNLMHGYLLQIQGLIELYSFSHFLHLNWNAFLEQSTWILKDLADTSLKPTSFPLAKVYIDVLHMIEIPHVEKELDLKSIMKIVADHLTRSAILKNGPQRELYKTAATKLVLFKFSNLIDTDILRSIYLTALEIRDPDLQLLIWSTLDKALCTLGDHESSKLLCDGAISTFERILPSLYTHSPELQDAIYDFLYGVLVELRFGECASTIVHTVLFKIRPSMTACYKRDSYIRLLGQSYITFSITQVSSELPKECVDDIYDTFCDSSWIGSLGSEYQLSIFKILFNMYFVNAQSDFIQGRMMLWWTCIVQLLVYDDSQVRHEVSKLIWQIGRLKSTFCFTATLDAFASIFCEDMSQTPVIACSLLFYWSMALLGDTDYEMDETDVFNKCRNYDVFEPVSIATKFANSAMHYFSSVCDKTMPEYAVHWINNRLNTDFPQSLTFAELVEAYKNYCPKLNGQLRDVLDPTYKEKLIQALAYDKWNQFLKNAHKEF